MTVQAKAAPAFITSSSTRLGEAAPVLPDEHRRRQSSAVKCSIGSLGPTTFKDMKPGAKQVLNDAVSKARRMKAKMGAPPSYISEVMETEYLNFMLKVADGVLDEAFMSELLMPKLPGGQNEKVILPMAAVREKRPRKSGMKLDAWRFGHVGGWICRDHFDLRRYQYQPTDAGTTAPRHFPFQAFTGRRRTVIYTEDGQIDGEHWDNFLEDRGFHTEEAWTGETWLEIKPEYLERAYPTLVWDDFQAEITNMMDNPGFEGSSELPNGDKCLVLRNCKKLSGLLPADENTPISTAAYFRSSGWLQLEDRICFRDRCMKRMKDVFLAETALMYVQITHASMMVGPENREPLSGELLL